MSQHITNPFGINVFGSASVEVEPDIAIVSFSVYPLFNTATEAFEASKQQSIKINQYFNTLGIELPKTGQITLRTAKERKNNNQEVMLGYEAVVKFTAKISQLERLEFIISGLVETGITEINSTQFRSSKYIEYRHEARRNAILSARQKAEFFCETAGIKLGEILHIEDLDFRSDGSTTDYMMQHDPSLIHAFNPSSILISASVRMSFSLTK